MMSLESHARIPCPDNMSIRISDNNSKGFYHTGVVNNYQWGEAELRGAANKCVKLDMKYFLASNG